MRPAPRGLPPTKDKATAVNQTLPPPAPPHIAVIGAGLSGLATAWYLQTSGYAVTVFEAHSHVGGVLSSVQAGAYLLEQGVDAMQVDARTAALLDALDLEAVCQTVPLPRRKCDILKDGRYQTLPTGPLSTAFGGFFSRQAKWRIASEPLRRHSPLRTPVEAPDTVGAFFRHRLGKEITDYAIAPLLAMYLAADPDTLLMPLTLPELVATDAAQHAIVPQLIPPLDALSSLNGGMAMLPEALAGQLKVRTHAAVNALIRRPEGRWCVVAGQWVQAVDAVVLALPAPAAAGLLRPHWAHAAAAIGAIHYAPLALIHRAYKRQDIGHALNSMGGFNPPVEHAFALGTVFASSMFTGRAPHDEVLLTTRVGGMLAPQRAHLADAVLTRFLDAELHTHLGIQAAPVFERITRHPAAMPQGDAQMLLAASWLPTLANDRLFVAGNWVGGTSVSACLARGQTLTETIHAALSAFKV